jgi:hypothetical protein
VIVAEDVASAVPLNEGAQRSGHNKGADLRVLELKPDRAAGSGRAQALLARQSAGVRSKSPGFDHVRYNVLEMLGQQKVRGEPAAGDFALYVNTHTMRTRRPALLDFPADSNSNNVVVGVCVRCPYVARM